MVDPGIYFLLCIALPFNLAMVLVGLAVLKIFFGVSFSSKSGASKKTSSKKNGSPVGSQSNQNSDNDSGQREQTSFGYDRFGDDQAHYYRELDQQEKERDEREAEERSEAAEERHEAYLQKQEEYNEWQEEKQRRDDAEWNRKYGSDDD